jgi:hypothetical protein
MPPHPPLVRPGFAISLPIRCKAVSARQLFHETEENSADGLARHSASDQCAPLNRNQASTVMNSSLCLVHLVSGQTLQNLLPMLAVRPGEVVQLRSRATRFDRSANAIRAAASTCGFGGRIVADEILDQESPGIEETEQKLREIIACRPTMRVIVNITGGTKLMSIGALKAAGDDHTSFYCDTESRGDFLHVGGPELPRHDSLDDVLRSLTIKTVMAAHGVSPDAIRSEVPSGTQMEFAREVAALRQTQNEPVSKCIAEVRKKFHTGASFLPKGKIAAALGSPLPPVSGEAEHAFLQVAKKSGWVREITGSYYLNPAPGIVANDKAVQMARSNFKAMEGGWWEMEVYRICSESGAFVDLQSEVQAAQQAEAIGESDLLGISLRKRALTFISCKVSDQHVKALEHAFEFTKRAQEFGGSAAQTVFVFHSMGNKDKRSQLESACKVLRSRLVVGEEELRRWLESA